MPQVLDQIADELLPALFRRRRPLAPRGVYDHSDTVNPPPYNPGGYPGTPPFVPGNVLMQDPKPTLAEEAISRAVPVDASPKANPKGPPPLSAPLWDERGNPINRGDLPSNTWDEKAPPTTPSPNVLAADPTVSRSGQVMDQYSTRPARRVETDKRGRPTRNIALEGDEQTLDYAGRVAKYEPQEGGGGWWPKIRAAIAGFAVGGPVGAAAGFGTRALREKFEPKLADQEWKRQQMGEIAPAVESIRQARKDRLGEESTRANIDLAKARTDALKNPRQNARIIERKDGVYMLNTKTGKFERIQEIPPEPGTSANARYFKAGNGEVWKVDEANPEGVRVKNIPGAPGKDTEDVSFSNAQLQQVIAEAQAEQKKIDSALPGIPMTIEATDILTGTKKMVTNPEYTYNMTRRRQLDDQIRRWRTQLKAPKKRAAVSSEADSDDPAKLLEDDEEP